MIQALLEFQENFHPRPKGGEVHRMMTSQTGEGKPSRRGVSTSRRADKNAHGQT